ncbi:MAG: hypothetical protein EBT92_10170 [Planctomycetes bacterium]|nr:hypothetical protein [Planctomycetota bacterium]
MALLAMPYDYKIIEMRDWYIGCAQPSQGCERGPTPLSRSFISFFCNSIISDFVSRLMAWFMVHGICGYTLAKKVFLPLSCFTFGLIKPKAYNNQQANAFNP